jgi:hypothetical protein
MVNLPFSVLVHVIPESIWICILIMKFFYGHRELCLFLRFVPLDYSSDAQNAKCKILEKSNLNLNWRIHLLYIVTFDLIYNLKTCIVGRDKIQNSTQFHQIFHSIQFKF